MHTQEYFHWADWYEIYNNCESRTT